MSHETKRTLPSGFITEWQYDWKDNVTNLVHKTSGGTVRAQVRYERSVGSEPTKILRDDNGSHSYVILGYDAAFRLQSEAHYTGGSNGSGGTLSETITYTYDANGSRTKIVNASGTFTNAITGGFRLTAVTNTAGGAVVESYGHDTGGRVTSIVRSGQNFGLGYNAADQLSQVIVTNGGNTTYAYTFDGAGRRVKATQNGGSERRFLMAGTPGTDLESPHLVADASNAIQQGYVFLGVDPLLRYDAVNGNNRVYYLEDGMGSVIGLADHSQNSVAVFKYDGFGQTRSATGTQVNPPTGTGGDFRFHGLWLESATSLYHVRARDYDPKTGRFLSRDPAKGDLRIPETQHPYSFAVGNTFAFSDPSGAFTLIELNSVNTAGNFFQAMRTVAVNEAKQRIKDKLFQALTSQVTKELQRLLPGGALANLDSVFKGRKFGEVLAEGFCKLLGADIVPEGINFEVGVDEKGEPQDDGLNCASILRGELPKVRPGVRRPDFIIGSNPHGSPGNHPRTFLVAEIKYRPITLYTDYVLNRNGKAGQLDAIRNYAAKHTYSYSAVFVTLKRDPAFYPQLKATIGKKCAEAGAIGLLITDLHARR